MIFCTVGTQLPFDRLVKYLSDWSSAYPAEIIVYQVGKSDLYKEDEGYYASIQEPLFSERFDAASVIVSHAGMGNIIRALDSGKPIVIVPRLSRFAEHINDHQLDTAGSFKGLPNVFLAGNYEQFLGAMKLAFDFKTTAAGDNSELSCLISAVSELVRS